MALLKVSVCRSSSCWSPSLLSWSPCAVRQLHLPPVPKDAYTSQARYPPLPQHDQPDRHRRQALSEFISGMRTVEEQLYFTDKPKYYGWYSYLLKAKTLPVGVNSVCLIDFATHTHHVKDALPPLYTSNADLETEAKEMADLVAPLLQRAVSNLECSEAGFEVGNDIAPFQQPGAVPSPKTYEGTLGKTDIAHPTYDVERQRRMLLTLNESIMRVLRVRKHDVTADLIEDYGCRNEAFWFKGGFDPDERMLRKRKGFQKFIKNPTSYFKNRVRSQIKGSTEEEVNARYERCMQYEGRPLVQLRHASMLSPFVDFDDELCYRGDAIPSFHNDPREAGVPAFNQHGTNVPGFWTCTDNRYIRLSFLDNCNTFDNEDRMIKDEDVWTSIRENHLNAKLALSSFGALMASSTHLGFGPFLNPTQPMSTQTVLTDGIRFKFGVYQLNTTNLIEDFTQLDDRERKAIRNNVCWSLPEQFLFDIDPQTRKWEINMDTLKTLIKFYITKPSQVIESDIQYIHQIKNDYNRNYFFNEFRHLYAKRERKFERPEIMAWQKLHMIDTKNWFPFGNREKPWFKMAKIDFLGKEHWNPEFKHLDYTMGKHLPRAHREHMMDRKKIKVVPPIPDDPPGEARTSFLRPLNSSFYRKVRFNRNYKRFFLKN